MPKLLDLLKFDDLKPRQKRPFFSRDTDRLQADERGLAILAGKYPLDGADIESVSEYRLASLMQYPHY